MVECCRISSGVKCKTGDLFWGTDTNVVANQRGVPFIAVLAADHWITGVIGMFL